MKKLILIIVLCLSVFGNAQAHLNLTLDEIKALYPNKVFTVDYTAKGRKYATAEMNLGKFVYYFDNSTNLSYYCHQHPTDINALNTQVEIYNNKYVVISETSWKAYLEDGTIIKINLVYEEEYKVYVFQYRI